MKSNKFKFNFKKNVSIVNNINNIDNIFKRLSINDNDNNDNNDNNDKQKIIDLFNKNIKNKDINLNDYNIKHNGKEGYWLEKNMNIKHNSNNIPDIYGYEMKKGSSKITFGDFTASEYLFTNKKYDISRDNFIKYFGNFNKNKNRYSWSGSCIPQYNIWNENGQILKINDNNDICIFYSYSKDKRINKNIHIPINIQIDNLLIVIWYKDKIKNHINNKFNNKGFFICKKDNSNKYNKICFGKPFDFYYFIESIKNYDIIFDSGMNQDNNRNYSHFRSKNKDFWEKLIIEEY